ncbi:MAG: Rpn family recombination-promoting nuclease/putative transposase [Azoarcus sp.]|jgi:predicted transposase/invertase (TIGR01784 family)|nr:Rpn family recombination-promoting nuclease/putative transposase [Azoarcus sp.]
MKTLLSPRSDIVFKMLFGDLRGSDILRAFLEAVLPRPHDEYCEIVYLNPLLGNDYSDDKIGILDVKVKTASGKIIDIEIQISNHSHLRERVVFYVSKLVTEQIGVGERYETIKPTVCILIADFVLIGENPAYHNQYRLRDFETRSEFTHLLEVHTLELPKLPKAGDGTSLGDWLGFLKADREDEMDVLAEKNPDVKKAVARLKEISADEQARMMYEARLKVARDRHAELRYATEKGREDALRAVARNALERDLSIGDVAALTGLSEDEIRALSH